MKIYFFGRLREVKREIVGGIEMKIKQATGATITYADLYKETTFMITDFGAIAGGSPVTNTLAINDAISAAHKVNGATVVIPEGEFKTYTIRLQSNVNIYITQNAVLQAAKTDITKSYQKQQGEGGNYDEPEVNLYAGLQDHGHTYFANSLIYGEDLENIMIYGEGLINGSCMDEETGLREYVLLGGDPFDNPMRNEKGHTGEWFGNKGIALVRCKNIVFKDFSILIGGHFAIIAEGVKNLLADHILVDTTRDAFDIDCCEDVTVINSVFNSLTDDALVVKASYGAGIFMPTRNVLIEDCSVSGYDAGSVYANKFTRDKLIATDRCGPTARVKLGTESTCGYDLVTIRRVKFDRSRGFALEAVDVSDLSNIILQIVLWTM
jgi:polygalacturonase